MTVQPIPEGYHTATPYLIIQDAAKALTFYQEAFSATELVRLTDPSSGKIVHAEIKIGDSTIMLADEIPEMGFQGPQALGGSGVSILLYVEDVDDRFQHAINAGAQSIRLVKDQFYGDRSGTLKDPFGHVWTIATHIEDVPIEEVHKRFKASLEV